MAYSDTSSLEHNLSDDESSQDDDTTEEGFREKLRECLDSIQHEGTFSAFHHFTSYVNPGLHLSNHGSVGLPLSRRDAEAITSVCKQSPFGKGEQTIVDTSVRKTWELDCTEFRCENPAWTGFVDGLVKQAVEDLGVQVATRAERYKLLLYEKGAFFKAHKDSEKCPGMFGTLVICLPSEHSGGEVHLVHGSQSRTLETAQTSSFNLSTLAWYADVQHEVAPVTAGYRLVLTYNLVQDGIGPKQTAAVLDQKHARFERALRLWNDDFCYQNLFIYPLEHQYTESSLCLKNLKGQDAAKGRCMQQMCSSNGVYWFLGGLTRETESAFGEEEEQKLFLDNIVTPNGTSIELLLDVDTDDILAEDLYHAGRDADSEDEGEYTGNEGTIDTYKYHDTVLILVPKAKIFTYIPTYQRGLNSLRAFFELIGTDEAAADIGTKLRLLTMILSQTISGMTAQSRHSHSYISYANRKTEAEAATVAFHAFFSDVSAYCLSIGHKSIVHSALRNAMKNPDWTSSSALVRLIARHAAIDALNDNPSSWNDWFCNSIVKPTFKQINDQCIALEPLRNELSAPTVSTFSDWLGIRQVEMLRRVEDLTTEDIPALVYLITTVSLETWNEVITPTLIKSQSRGALIHLLDEMRKLANVTDSWGIAVKFTYKKVIQDNAALFNIVTGDFGTGEKITYPGVQSFPPYHRQGSLAGYPMQLLGVIDQAMVFGLREEIKLLVAAATPLIPHFDSIWSNWVQIISYIEKLATILGRHRRDDANAQTQPFFKLALHNVTSTLFSQRPIEPNDWKRSSDKVCSCKCSPCQWLQKFLDHPTQHTGKFAYAKHIRDHLQYQLDDQDFQFHTEKFRSPHTLVITKTKNEYARLAKEWHSDVEALRVRLQELRSDFLQSLLGHEYEPLLSLHQAPSTVGEHGYQALQAVSASVWNSRDSIQITGVKRKAIDVVDLTEDASEQY